MLLELKKNYNSVWNIIEQCFLPNWLGKWDRPYIPILMLVTNTYMECFLHAWNCVECFVYIVISCLQQTYKEFTIIIIIPVVQMKKLKPGEIKW